MILFKKFITREFIKLHSDWYFVFGDNDQRKGHGGRAQEMRGEHNSIGIRVKKAPGIDLDCYYTDDEYYLNLGKITEDFGYVVASLKLNKNVVIPKDGIGTGLARLSEFAPKTLKFIESTIKGLELIYNAKEI